MSKSSTPSDAASVSDPPPMLRWFVLAALLIGEVSLLRQRYDISRLREQSEWWAEFLCVVPHLNDLFLIVAAATLFLGGVSLWREMQQLPVPPLSYRTSALLLLGHFTALAAFVGVTALLLEGDAAVVSKSAWMVLWLVLGPVVVGLWVPLVMPLRLWGQLIRRNYLVLLAGLGVGALAYGAGVFLESCWEPLAAGTLWIANGLLRLIYTDVVYQPDMQLIGTPNYEAEIGSACSGYEGIGLISIFVAAFLWLFRRYLRFPQSLLLWPIGVALIWSANALRITALVIIGAEGWPEVADGGFHSVAGCMALDIVALGLAVAACRLRFFAAQPPDTGEPPFPLVAGPNPATAYLMPFLAILATTMITTAFSAGFDLLYPLRVLAVAAVLWTCRRAYAELRWSWAWQPFALGIGVFALWIALVPSGIGQPSPLGDGLARLSPTWATVWLLFRITGATITVPFAEELAFRGYLLRRLQSADWNELPLSRPSWMAVLISSILFGLLHNHWLAGTLAGLLYALAASRRGYLLDAVLAHAVTNALLAGYVLATRAWALWS